MKPSHGPVEILRYPNGGFTIITKAQWQSFLKKSLDSTSTSGKSSVPRGVLVHGMAQVR
jgi:hypothetical protein